MSKPLSNCHQAPVKLVGGTGDFSDHDKGITMHYECTQCGKACDIDDSNNKELASQPKPSLDEILDGFDPFDNSHYDFLRRKPEAKTKLEAWRDAAIVAELKKLKKEQDIDIGSYGAIACDYLAKCIDERIKELGAKNG